MRRNARPCALRSHVSPPSFSNLEKPPVATRIHSFRGHPIYSIDSGGDPRAIPNLTYEAFAQFHRTYYHPANARLFVYGKEEGSHSLGLKPQIRLLLPQVATPQAAMPQITHKRQRTRTATPRAFLASLVVLSRSDRCPLHELVHEQSCRWRSALPSWRLG